jgi:tetratricopeptide (TPR) repeat protein
VKSAKRINLRLLVAIAVAVLIGIVGVAVVHRIQVRRNASGLAALARLKVTEGQPGEAIMLYARYLRFRPDDATAQAEFARLLVVRATAANAGKGDRAMAYDAVETAVSKNPDDRKLRATLADFMLRSGRFGAAGEQLDILLADDAATSAADGLDSDDDVTAMAGDRDALTLMRARAHLGMGNYREAAALLAGICGFDMESRRFAAQEGVPEPADAMHTRVVYQASVFLSALLDEKLRSPAGARAVLDHLVETAPGEFRGWLARANWHRSHDAFAEAAADLAKARELAPDDVDVLFTSFEIAIAQGRFADAEQMILEARRLFPADERVYRGMASLAARQGDLERANTVLREALTTKLNDHSRVSQLLVDVLMQQGRPQEAEAALAAHAEKYGDESPEIGLLQARLLIAQRRWLPAKKKLDALRPLVATSTALTNQIDLYLAQCYEQLGEFDEQLAANRRVLSEDHASMAAKIGAAAALAATGRPDEALVEYESLAAALSAERLAAAPQVWQPLLQLRVGQQLRRPAADRDWTRTDALLDVLEQSPAVSSTQMALLKSDALLRKGNTAAAESLLRSQLEIDPRSPQLTAALLLLALRTQDPPSAHRLLDAAPPEVVDSPVVMMAAAQVAARLPAEESAAAFASIESRAAALPGDESGQLFANLGSIRRGTGNLAEAERLWNAALTKRPEDIQIIGALQELACDRGDVERATATAAEIARLSGQNSPQGRVATAAALLLAVRQQQARRLEAATPAQRRTAATPTPQERERLTSAYNLLVEAENERPGWTRIQRLFADIAILRGDLPEAVDRLQRATRQGAADPALLRQLLSLLYMTNRLEEAQQTLAKLGPEGASGLERLSAEIDLGTGRFDDAVTAAERSLDSGEQAGAADLLWFGQVLARAGKVERAAEVLQRAVDADPGRPEGWLALLSVQFSAGQRQTAERTLDRAGEALEPPRREMVLAQGSEMLGRLDDAERNFREAAAADQRSTAAARSLASFLVRRGRLAAARDELRAIISATPSAAESDDDAREVTAWARRALALLLAQTGGFRDIEEALALLGQNATDGKLSAEDLALTINVLANRPEPANWRRAIDLLDELKKLQPLSNGQRVTRVRLLERCGRWEDARNELVAVVSRPPALTAVLSLLVEKLIQHGERDAARNWLKKLSDQEPDSTAVLVLQTRLALADNDRAAATEAARRLMPDESPDTPPEQVGAAAVLMEQLGFPKAADKLFERYAKATKAGVLARAGFLGRQHRVDEALDTIDRDWDRLPLLPLMQTAVLVVRTQGANASADHLDRVAGWFVKAERQDPESAPLMLLHADLLSLAGRDDDAVAIYRDLLARKDLPPVQTAVIANNLAYLLAQPDTASEAGKLIDAALVELGPNPDILDTRGVVLLAAGKTDEAIATLQDAVLVPSAAKYLHLACALAAGRRMDEARKALSEAKTLGLDPQTLSHDDRRRLATLETAFGG